MAENSLSQPTPRLDITGATILRKTPKDFASPICGGSYIRHKLRTEGSKQLDKQLRWHHHFLQLCLDHARMSKDPSTQVGALLIGPDREPLSDGFNGFPRGIEDNPIRLNDRELKNKIIVHAEMNAVLNAARVGTALKGSTLYLAATNSSGLIWGGPPCTRCTVELIQAGITKIITWKMKDIPSRWKDDIDFARDLIREVGLEYTEL